MAVLGEHLWSLVGRSLAAAERHRIAPLLHRHQPEAAAETDRQAFAAAHRRTVAANLRFLSVCREVLGAFRSASIPVIPLKGVLFALRYYGEIGVRPQSDVDLLVHRPDLSPAHEQLLRLGFDEAWPRAYYADHYHWVYRRGDVLLELHWALKAPGTCTPDLDRIWSEVCWRAAEGLEFLEMAPVDLLAYLAVNKAHQRFPALIDFVDLARIVDHAPPAWDRLVERALHDGTAAPLWFGLCGIKELLGASVPERVLNALAAPAYVRPARWLKKALDAIGGPLRVPPRYQAGPIGRLYESCLEGRPSAIFHLLRPLVFPSKARVELLAQGSYARYYIHALQRFVN